MKKPIVVLLHLSYWLMYLFIIAMMLQTINHGGQRLTGFSVLFFSPIGVSALIPGLIGFYVFYGILFKKFLSAKKTLRFFLAVLVTVFFAGIITELVLFSFFRIDSSTNTIIFMGLFLCFICFVNGILGLIMKGFISWFNDIKVKLELNKKNHEMEIALMKAQINPHFLFNTINNIDVLIQMDAVKASEYLNKLSDIMRFMLYETKGDKILLAEELSYIKKYIELQKIRTTNPDYVKLDVKGNAGKLMIEPMIFIPFIENAFKHTENKKVENAIILSFDIDKERIRFGCENTYSAAAQMKPEHGGLGNELIRRRLELIYTGKHKLEVINNNGVYKVNLTLSLQSEN